MVEEEQIIEDEEFRQSMGYGYPQEAQKNNPIAFFKELIARKSNIKSANLTEDELGSVRIPVRTNLEISEYCNAMKMTAFSRYFRAKSQVIQATSLRLDGEDFNFHSDDYKLYVNMNQTDGLDIMLRR